MHDEALHVGVADERLGRTMRPARRQRRTPRGPLSPLRRPRPLHGFTLIELIVAVAILSLMMGLASRIFFDAQAAVSRGMQISQILAQSRAISQPLLDDARNMRVFLSKYGSNSPGFLVIVQQTADGVKFPDVTLSDPNQETSQWVDRTIRTDQIAFFRDAEGLESLTPGTASSYDSQARALTARVWYGHVWPANVPDTSTTMPGDEGYDLSSQLMLGRQALLLVENNPATTYPDGTPGDDAGSSATDARFINMAGSTDVEAQSFAGTMDVLDLENFGSGPYSTYDDGGADPAGDDPSLFRTPTYEVTTPNPPSYFGDRVDSDGYPESDYLTAALEWMYTTPGERLQASRYMPTTFNNEMFTVDQMGQLHASFVPHVADFAIEIAADWTDDLLADGTPGQDGMPDGVPDRDAAGNIKWYTLTDANPDGDGDGNGSFTESAPVTYQAPTTIASFDGSAGGTITNPFIDGNTFVFSHTGDNEATDEITNPPDGLVEGAGKYWPYLIRFRYRLMDGQGHLRTAHPNTGDPVAGRWFEQIVPVPRPTSLY